MNGVSANKREPLDLPKPLVRQPDALHVLYIYTLTTQSIQYSILSSVGFTFTLEMYTQRTTETIRG